MNTDDVLAVFREAGAILEGHFILTSGLRSPVFLQKARVFMHADKTEKLCKALAEKIRAADLGPIDYVVGPAIGGLIPSYETSRHLGVPRSGSNARMAYSACVVSTCRRARASSSWKISSPRAFPSAKPSTA